MDKKLLANQLDLFHAIFDKSCDAIVIVDAEFRVRYWSKSAESLFGYQAETVVGKELNELITPTRNRQTIRRAFADYQSRGHSHLLRRVHEVKALCENKTEIWVDISLTDIRVDEEMWLLAIIRSAEARKQKEKILAKAAATDSLSGLSNRSEFQRQLELNQGFPIALAIVDIDHFKQINDQHGHPVGDEAIQTVASILHQSFGKALCVARLGGDEFGVILQVDSEVDLESKFESFKQDLEQSSFGEQKLKLEASIGVAIANENSTPRSLLTTADHCLYQAKREGRNRVVVSIDETDEAND